MKSLERRQSRSDGAKRGELGRHDETYFDREQRERGNTSANNAINSISDRIKGECLISVLSCIWRMTSAGFHTLNRLCRILSLGCRTEPNASVEKRLSLLPLKCFVLHIYSLLLRFDQSIILVAEYILASFVIGIALHHCTPRLLMRRWYLAHAWLQSLRYIPEIHLGRVGSQQWQIDWNASINVGRDAFSLYFRSTRRHILGYRQY